MSGTEFFELWHDERLDSTEQLGFTLAADNPKAELIVEDAEIEWNGRRFFVHEVKTKRAGTQLRTQVRASALWYRLSEKKRVGSIDLQSEATRDGLDIILRNTGWTSSGLTMNSQAVADVRSMEDQDASVMKLVRRWADLCGGFVVFDTWNKHVDVVLSRGSNFGSSFRYGRNLTEIERTVYAPRTTRLYPFGVDDLTIKGLIGKEYVEDFSFYTDQGIDLGDAVAKYTKEEVAYDSTITDDVTLLAWGRKKLADLSAPEVTYKCKVVNLEGLTPEANEYQLSVGDKARVADEPLGLDVSTTVTRYKSFPNEPWRDEVELSYLYAPAKPSGSSGSRPSTSLEWLLFKHDNANVEKSRFESTLTSNRIGLKFREGGEAVYGYDINFVGVGTGSVSISAIDSERVETQEDTLLHEPLTLSWVDGQVVHENMTWAMKDLQRVQDVRIRMEPDTGGPSGSNGFDIPIADSRLWVLARGAVRETPTDPTTAQFWFNGTSSNGWAGADIQHFTVPDGVYEVTAEVAGASGGQSTSSQLSSVPGNGTKLVGTFSVVPGEVLDVFVGGSPGCHNISGANPSPGWPNGGCGGPRRTGATRSGGGGGGASAILREGTTWVDALMVAGGGGGMSEAEGLGLGDSGYYEAKDGRWYTTESTNSGGRGATQWEPGIGGQDTNPANDHRLWGDDGGRYDDPAYCTQNNQNQVPPQVISPPELSARVGGKGGDTPGGTSSASYYGAGGGGGWCGGGGGTGSAGLGFFRTGTAGGGGSSYHNPEVYDTGVFEAFNDSQGNNQPPGYPYGLKKPHGWVHFSWEDPNA